MKTKIFTLLFIWSASLLYSQKNDWQISTDSTSYFGRESCWSYKAKIYEEIEIFHWDPVQCYLQGDTVINHKNYKQYHTFYPFTAIRQENQKIYAIDTDFSKEYLLYDFGVEKGNIIYSEAQSGYISRMPVVEDVDSVWLYNGERRKRIHIAGDTWIEGIGSVRGFDSPIREYFTCDCNNEYQLIAFAQEGVVSFFDSELATWWGYCGEVVDVFPRSDAIWNIKINGKEHYYGLSGDTIIQGKPYNKLYLLNDTTLNIDADDEYIGGFRQEGGKVWYLPEYFFDETLVYDFSANVGDTIWHNVVSYSFDFEEKYRGSLSVVEDISFEQDVKRYTSTQYINRDLLNPYGTDVCIEEIGSVRGLFWFLYRSPMGASTSIHLACLKQGNEVKYVDNTCDICFYGAAVDIPKIEPTNVDLFYENKRIRIIGDSSTFPCQLKLFNSTGTMLFEQSVVSDKEPITLNQNLQGVYIFQIQKDNTTVVTGKIIIK
jgi:hypothetical protein